MSEFLAEAQVLITPNTAAFRTTLLAQLTAIQRSIPGIVIPVSGFDQASLRTAAAGVAASASEATAAINGETTSLTRLSRASVETAAAQKTLASSQALASSAARNAERGIFTQVASLAGLRGAVLGANSAFIVGAAGAIAFFKSLQLAAGVEQDLATFRVTVGATAEELSKVSEEARVLGRDITLPGVGARDAVQAMLSLAKAGLTVQDSLDAARGVLQLATAAELDNASASLLVANALNSFGLAGSEAVKIADLLANAANSSQASIEDMGIALRQVAGAAAQVGLSAEDTVVLLTQLAKAGLAGSDAGTTLRVALVRLVAGIKPVDKELQKLHVTLRDTQGNLRPDIFAQIGVALQGMDRAAQDNAFVTLFGQNAIRVGAILARQGVPALNDTTAALRKQGTAAQVAAAKNEGLAGSVENAKNQFAAFSLEVGQLASPLASLGLDGVALLFGVLADSLHGIHEAWKQQIDDLEQVAGAFKSLSDDSGFTDFVNQVNEGGRLLQGDLQKTAGFARDYAKSLFGIGSSADNATDPVNKLQTAVGNFTKGADVASVAAHRLAGGLDEIAQSSAKAASPQAKLGLSIEGARASGNDDSLLGLLQQREENLQAFIDRLSKRDQTKAVVKTLTEANQDLGNVRDEIKNILDQRAQDTEQAATEAARSRDRADNAFLDMLGATRDRAANSILKAQGTDSLKDDLKAQQTLLTILTQQLERIRKTVVDAKAKAAAMASVVAEMVRVGQEIKSLRKAQRDALLAAAEERQTQREQSINLDIDFAQTVGNREAEIKARRRLIALLKKELREVKKGTNAWKELRNAIAEQQQAIKGTQDQKKEAGNTLAQSQFEFMQKQQGFAANLLGNLIPGFATAGLVGNQSDAGTHPFDTGVQAQASVSKSAERGVRPVQVDTTNHLLRQILSALNGRQTKPPEVRHNRVTSGGMMDTL